jgi:hypothetical protein
MTAPDLFKVIVFAAHFSFFALAGLFFLLKFHKKGKLKIVLFSATALWILFGTIAFILELIEVLSILT